MPHASQGRDRRRTTPPVGRRVTFTPLDPGVLPSAEQVTSVAVVPFAASGELVAVLLDRGVDLPGGHVREDEDSLEETARREAWEEARVELGPLVPAQVIRSDLYGDAPEDLTYMVVYAARVTRLAPFAREHESHGRVLLDPEEFLSRYRAGDPALMRRLVEAAWAALGGR